MPAVKELDTNIFALFYRRYQEAQSKNERGNIMREMSDFFGMSYGALRKRIRRKQAGESIQDVAQGERKRQSKKRSLERKKRKQLAIHIAKIKFASKVGRKNYVLPTKTAMEKSVILGICTPEELPDRSTMDRWLNEFGLANWQFNLETPAKSWQFSYAGQVYFVDATPLNKIYMQLGGSLKTKIIEPADKHKEDILRENHLSKIWVYCIVDGFSRAFFTQAFAPPTGGENKLDLIKFLNNALLYKPDYPFEGVPEYLYSDKGSGLTSNFTKNYLLRLGSDLLTHEVGNSRAKGHVEARFSAMKRGWETLLNLLDTRLDNLDDLNYFLRKMSYRKCMDSGYFEKFAASARKHPLRKVTIKNIQDATVQCVTCTLNVHKCIKVRIDKTSQEYEVLGALDLPKGTKFNAYRDRNGEIVAQEIKTGRIFRCDPRGRHYFNANNGYTHLDAEGNPREGWKETEGQRLRKIVDEESRKIRSIVSISDILPEEDNTIVNFPPQGNYIETHSISAPEYFQNLTEAKKYIEQTTGITFTEIDPESCKNIIMFLETCLKTYNNIPRDRVYEMVHLIQDEIIPEIEKAFLKEDVL